MTEELTVTAPSRQMFSSDVVGEQIQPQRVYVFDGMVTSSSRASAKLPVQSEEAALATLPPWRRWGYLARNNPSEFVVSIVALCGGIYMVVGAAWHFMPHLASVFSWAAYAQGQSGAHSAPNTSRDLFDWYVGGLMGICLLSSLGMTMMAQVESKISFGKDTTKMILGFVVGFLSGAKPR